MSNVLATAIVRIGGDIADLEAALSLAEEQMHKAANTLKGVGESMTKYITLPLLALGGLAVKEFADQETQLAKLNGVIASTGGAAGVTTEHIVALAEALQKTTTFSHDTTESAAAVLLSFQNVRNELGAGNAIFDRTIKAAQGLSSLMGTDLQDAVRTLGVALEDPAEGLLRLRRANIVLSEAEKDQIRDLMAHGQALEAQRLILDKVEGKFKEVTAAMAKTPTGAMKQAWNEVKEALEGVGKILAPLVVSVAHSIKAIAEAFQGLSPAIKVVIVAVASIAAVIGPAIVAFVKLQAAWKGMQAVLLLSGTTFGVVFAWVGLIALAIVGLISIAVQLATNWNTVTLKIAKAWTWLKEMAVGLWTYIGDAMYSALEGIIKFLAGIPLIGALFKDAAADVASAHQSFINSSAQALMGLNADMTRINKALEADILAAGDNAATAGEQVEYGYQRVKKGVAQVPPWSAAAKKALGELDAALAANTQMAKLLGPSYDKAGADAGALQTALGALIQAGVPLGARLDATGRSIRSLGADMKFAADSSELLKTLGDAATELDGSLTAAGNTSLLLGANFDYAGAQADALEAYIAKVVATGVDLDAILPGVGASLRQLQERMKGFRQTSDTNTKAQDTLNDAIAHGVSIVQSSMTPLQEYQKNVNDVTLAYVRGKISLDQYNQALDYLKKQLEGTNKFTDQLKQGIVDMTGRAVDAFMDMALSGKQSFGEMIESMLQDLTKLIIKLEIMNLLFSKGGPLAKLGKYAGFQHGGFVAAGEAALVGETGPELITAGRQGVTVTPLERAHAASSGGSGGTGDAVNVTVQVAAMDAQGVSQFFEQNEGLVTNAILRSFQRSRILRNRLGGG